MGNGTCTQCGDPADTGLIFCKKCGATLRPPVPLNPASSQADAPRVIKGGSKFWLTWKEFLTVMSVLLAFLVAASLGGTDDAGKAVQVLGSIGGIYLVLYVVRAMRARG
jgi:hypothetical protein